MNIYHVNVQDIRQEKQKVKTEPSTLREDRQGTEVRKKKELLFLLYKF